MIKLKKINRKFCKSKSLYTFAADFASQADSWLSKIVITPKIA